MTVKVKVKMVIENVQTSSYIPYGSLRAVVPNQSWTRSSRPYRGNVDDRSASLLIEKPRYYGRCAKKDTFDIDVEAFVKVGFSNL